MNFIAIVQARLNSSRFPGKVLKKIRNKTLLEILHNRLKQSKTLINLVKLLNAGSFGDGFGSTSKQTSF